MSDQTYARKAPPASVIDQLKIPPHSIEAEQSVLGGLLLDNQAWDKISDILLEKDFYQNGNRVIFRAIVNLFRQGNSIDTLMLIEHLKDRKELDLAGGEVYLFELAKNTPSAANIISYATIVRERSILRQLISSAGEIADSAYHPNGRAMNELLDMAERKIFSIAEQDIQRNGPADIKMLAQRALERLDYLFHAKQSVTGLATGFTDLDEMTSGLQPSDLIILAGRPSMGKTALAMNIAESVAIKNKKTVLIFSMEMPGDSLVMRMLSSLGRIEQHRVRTGKLEDADWPRITSVVNMLTESSIFIDDTPALSPTDLRSRARRLVREQGNLGLIMVDYLQLMQVPGIKENRTAEISEISRALKGLARELNVPVIALSQLNRSLEQRSDKRPVMSDLRESGSIEQDADLIVFIYRDEVYHEDTPEKGVAEIILAKHRNGPIGRVKLTFNGQFTRFDNYMPNRLGYEGYS